MDPISIATLTAGIASTILSISGLFQDVKDARDEINAICAELRSLQGALDLVPPSLQPQIQNIVSECNKIVKEIGSSLMAHGGSGWGRIWWTLRGGKEDIAKLRSNLASQKSSLNAALTLSLIHTVINNSKKETHKSQNPGSIKGKHQSQKSAPSAGKQTNPAKKSNNNLLSPPDHHKHGTHQHKSQSAPDLQKLNVHKNSNAPKSKSSNQVDKLMQDAAPSLKGKQKSVPKIKLPVNKNASVPKGRSSSVSIPVGRGNLSAELEKSARRLSMNETSKPKISLNAIKKKEGPSTPSKGAKLTPITGAKLTESSIEPPKTSAFPGMLPSQAGSTRKKTSTLPHHEEAHHKIKKPTLFKGNLVLDCPIRSQLHGLPPTLARDETTHTRYTSIQCEPGKMKAKDYCLRQLLFTSPRPTNILAVVDARQSDVKTFALILQRIEKNVAHLTEQTTHPSWGAHSWKWIVVCLVFNQNLFRRPQSKENEFLQAMGVLWNGRDKDDVQVPDPDAIRSGANAHLYECTSIVTKFHDTTPVIGRIPLQMLLLVERPAENIKEGYLQDIVQLLQARSVTHVDFEKQQNDHAFFEHWEKVRKR